MFRDRFIRSGGPQLLAHCSRNSPNVENFDSDERSCGRRVSSSLTWPLLQGKAEGPCIITKGVDRLSSLTQHIPISIAGHFRAGLPHDKDSHNMACFFRRRIRRASRCFSSFAKYR
jgi:hypothetical protein